MHLKDKNLKYYRDFSNGKLMINFSNLDFTNVEDNLKIVQINNMIKNEEKGVYLYQKNGELHLSEDYIEEFYEISLEEFEEMFPNFILDKLDDIKFSLEYFYYGLFSIKINNKKEYQQLVDKILKEFPKEDFPKLNFETPLTFETPLYYDSYFYFKKNKLVQSIKSYLPTIYFQKFANNSK